MPQFPSIMKTHWDVLLPHPPFQLVSATQGGHDPHLGQSVATRAQNTCPRGNFGAYLGWPGSVCGRRVPWCCPRPRSRSSAQPSCSHAQQRPQRTAGPGAGSGRAGSCWRTCQTAGGKGFVVSAENSMDNRPRGSTENCKERGVLPGLVWSAAIPKRAQQQLLFSQSIHFDLNNNNLKQGDSREQTQSEEKQMHYLELCNFDLMSESKRYKAKTCFETFDPDWA